MRRGREANGGKGNDRGTPQRCDQPSAGEPVYEPDVEGMASDRAGGAVSARIVNYADDLVILSRGKAKEALGWLRGALERLELTLNEKKTSLRNARRERFDFLGYTFGPHSAGGLAGSISDTVHRGRA